MSLKFLNFGLLSKLQEPLAGSLPGGPRCREALVAGRPSLPGGPLVGATSWKRVPPRDRPGRCSKSFILWQNLTWQNPASISRIQVCLTSRPSLPGGPRCREALVTGRPSLPVVAGKPSLPGGPRCREALVAGRLSLSGSPRCREALVAGRPSLPGGPRCREALVAGGPRRLVGATSWKRVPPKISQECALVAGRSTCL